MFSKSLSLIILLLLITLLSFCSINNNSVVKVENNYLVIEFDDSLYSKVISKIGNEGVVLSDYSATEYLIVDDVEISKYYFKDSQKNKIENALGKGEEVVITGLSKNKIQKQVTVTIYKNYPTTAFYKVAYKNNGSNKVIVNKWVNNSYRIIPEDNQKPSFWSYQGASYEDRRDWVVPLAEGFEQENYLGMNASDYGSGTPITDIWRKDVGIAVGHVETTPKLVKLPVKMKDQQMGVDISVEYEKEITLEPGQSLETFE
ncbi:MAG: hypothetical protein WBG58_12930, partial [Ignavibacteriaceae bacterium]